MALHFCSELKINTEMQTHDLRSLLKTIWLMQTCIIQCPHKPLGYIYSQKICVPVFMHFNKYETFQRGWLQSYYITIPCTVHARVYTLLVHVCPLVVQVNPLRQQEQSNYYLWHTIIYRIAGNFGEVFN